MRFYTHTHGFYCGIDLHARTMHLCVLDQAGDVVCDKNIAARPDTFLKAIAPFRDNVVVGVECMYAWYWLADRCAQEQISFVLGHALYMKLIYGAKAKNDQIDAGKIARLLRGGNFPLAYVYPKGMRETRDLLRRRNYLVRQRAALFTHLQILNGQYNLPPFPKKLSFAANRAELDIAQRFEHPSVQRSAAVDLAVIDALDEQIGGVELYLTRTAKVDDVQTYHRLQTIPGVGKVLALVLLYEIHDSARFDSEGRFLSYARLVRCEHESAGKKLGSGGAKIGNAHLRWANACAACLFSRSSERAKKWKEKQLKKRGEGRVLAMLAARWARAVYHLWRKGQAFDETLFWQGQAVAAAVR
ncbi:MAG: IS110 family transposase [Gemmataceae bacterium]|nr:IS110 family transposase [Gemmataceae bacterium]